MQRVRPNCRRRQFRLADRRRRIQYSVRQRRENVFILNHVASRTCRHNKIAPVFGRKSNAPHITGNLEFQSHLKQLPHRSRPLDPRHTPAHLPRQLSCLRVRNLQSHPHVLQDVVFRLVAAAMAINDQARRALNKRPPQRIHALHHQGHSLHNPRTAPLAQFLACIHCVFRNHIHTVDRFAVVPKIERLRRCLKLTASRALLQSSARSLPNSSISRRFTPYLSRLFALPSAVPFSERLKLPAGASP